MSEQINSDNSGSKLGEQLPELGELREPDNADWKEYGSADFGNIVVDVWKGLYVVRSLYYNTTCEATKLRDDLTAALAWAQRQQSNKGAKP